MAKKNQEFPDTIEAGKESEQAGDTNGASDKPKGPPLTAGEKKKIFDAWKKQHAKIETAKAAYDAALAEQTDLVRQLGMGGVSGFSLGGVVYTIVYRKDHDRWFLKTVVPKGVEAID